MKKSAILFMAVVWLCGCLGPADEMSTVVEPLSAQENPVQSVDKPIVHTVGVEFTVAGPFGEFSDQGALVVENDGALYLKGDVSNSERLTPEKFAPPGAPISMVYQGSQLTVFVIGRDGCLYVLWRNRGGGWSQPVSLTKPGFATPGARLAVDRQMADQLDVFVVDSQGTVKVLYCIGEGAWSAPISLSMTHFAPPGAGLATGHQGSEQLDLFVVDNVGVLRVLAVTRKGNWSSPINLTGPGFAPPGAGLATGTQGMQLDVFVINSKGALSLFYTTTGPWSLATPLSGDNFAPPGGVITAGVDRHSTLRVFVVDNQGIPNEFAAQEYEAWTEPRAIPGTAKNFAPPGGSLSYFVMNGHNYTKEGLCLASNQGVMLSLRDITYDWTTPSPLK